MEKQLHEKTISEIFKERWNHWQNWLSEAGARDFEANQIGHAVQNEVEELKKLNKQWAIAVVKYNLTRINPKREYDLFKKTAIRGFSKKMSRLDIAELDKISFKDDMRIIWEQINVRIGVNNFLIDHFELT